MCVVFPVVVDGITRNVFVSYETLDDHFGGTNIQDKKFVFESNRSAIESKARKIIENGTVGDVLIKTAMF